jgi:hypothetical protein
VDPGQVSADYEKGVLKIKLAKKAEAKPKQIKVNVGSQKTLEVQARGQGCIKPVTAREMGDGLRRLSFDSRPRPPLGGLTKFLKEKTAIKSEQNRITCNMA